MLSAATAGGALLLTLVAAIAYHFKLLPGLKAVLGLLALAFSVAITWASLSLSASSHLPCKDRFLLV